MPLSRVRLLVPPTEPRSITPQVPMSLTMSPGVLEFSFLGLRVQTVKSLDRV